MIVLSTTSFALSAAVQDRFHFNQLLAGMFTVGFVSARCALRDKIAGGADSADNKKKIAACLRRFSIENQKIKHPTRYKAQRKDSETRNKSE